MPPHIFHASSDDPARWERQFGCMAALFHMLHHHHPRFFRKRSSASGSAAACGHSHIQSTCINKPAKPRRPVDHSGSKNDHHMEAAHVKTRVKKRSSAIRERSPEVTHHKGITSSSSSDFSVDYTLVEAVAAPYSHKVSYKQYYKRESASILDSSKATNYTIREPPRNSFEGTGHSPDQCCSSPPASADRSCSLPGSPHVRFSKIRDGRSQFVPKSLFDEARVSLPSDYDTQGQEADYRCHISHINEESSHNEACKDPLEQLKESLRALAKIQQTTQQIVDGFEAQKLYADKAAKKTIASSLPWWNARKVRSSNNRHTSQTSMEGPALEARISSFDYTEAIRISQKIDDTPARLSLDGREIVPKVVLKLREAMRLGIVNRDLAKSSAIDDQKKRIDCTSLRSALFASKEEFETVKGISSNSAKSVAHRGGQRSNVIARLMGLHDLPMSRDGSMESKHRQPRLLKDLENNPQRWDNRFDTKARPQAEYCSSAKHKSDCTIGGVEQITSVYGSAGASKLIKREAFVHEDRRAQALQKDHVLNEIEVDDRKRIGEGIEEMRLSIATRAGSHSPGIKDNGPTSKIPRHGKMEAMPSHLLISTRAEDRSGRARAALHDSEKISEIVLQERFKERQEHVKELRDVEFELGRSRQVKTCSSRLQYNTDVELSLVQEVKGLLHPQIQENRGGEYCVETGEISDEKLSQFHQSKNASKRYDQSMVTQSHVSQLESKLLESSKVLRPPCRMKTQLSVENNFPFDFPAAENEETSQISISPSVDDHPKLQLVPRADHNNKADHAASSTSSSPSRKSHYRSEYKRNLGEHDKKEPGTKHQLQRRAGVKLLEAGDQTPTIATKRPASPTATLMMTRDIEKASCLRKHHPGAEAAPGKVGTRINQLAAREEYKVGGRSNRKRRSLDITKNGVRKISDQICAKESARAKAGSKMKRNGDKSHKVGLGGRTVSMRSSVVRRAAAGSTLELVDTKQLICSPSYGCIISNQADSTSAAFTKCHISLDAAAEPQPQPEAAPLRPAAIISSKTATILDVVADDHRPVSTLQSPRHHDYVEVAGIEGKFEYVEAILEHAGLLGNKDNDDLERQRHLGAWMMSYSIALATFLEMECSGMSTFGSRHQRRLIFDCVYHIVAIKTTKGDCKRGLLLEVWKEMKRQMVVAETGLHLSTCNSNDQQVYRLLIKSDMDELEQSQESCWTCSSPSFSSSHLTYSLEDAIFQDLLQELIIS